MGLRDHRIASRNRGDKISAGRAIECERKIVRTHDDHGTNRLEPGSDIRLRIDRRKRPRAFGGGGSALAKLIDGSRQLDVGEPWRFRKRGFQMRLLDQLALPVLEPFGEAREKLSD